MYRLNIPLLSQETIANALGLIVPKKDAQFFEKVRTGRQPASGWGTHIQEKKYELSKALKKLDTGLKARVYLADQIKSAQDLKETLTEQLDEDADILICFDYQTLWGSKGETGHVNVFDFIEGNTVQLIDPEYEVPKYRKTSVAKLFKAIVTHGAENSGGLWLIERDKLKSVSSNQS